MEKEILLTGGRVTSIVTKKGKYVYRPCCKNSPFVHSVLIWIEKRNPVIAPHFIGIADDGREITSFLEGNSPNDLGDRPVLQLIEAGKLISNLHKILSDFPGCKNSQTVCHNDLSPCNFMFKNDIPYAVFDWDTAAIGDPMDELAYAVWMWCDIGNREQSKDLARRKVESIMEGYGINNYDISDKIIEQMYKRYKSSFDLKGWENFRQWVMDCIEWVEKNRTSLKKG